MKYTSIANNGIVDFEVGKIHIDYSNSNICIELKNRNLTPAVLDLKDFIELTITKTEPWGSGIYVASSEIRHKENKVIVEIELNSGDILSIVLRN